MKIKEITYRNRRDFKAIFVCEHCGYEYEDWGYDNDYFHKVVIPQKMKCPKCGKKSGKDYKPRGTKYPENQIV